MGKRYHEFSSLHGALWEHYQRNRRAVALPLKLADGNQIYLTPGKHNKLQIAVIELFGPRFAPASTVLYLGDTANKFLYYEKEKIKELGMPLTMHDKLPDIILYDETKNLLYLIEAVTSHGPVTPKRQHEWESLLKDCTAKRIYISAFLDFAELRRRLLQVAWDTHVWVAEMPEHMIHYNDEKYME